MTDQRSQTTIGVFYGLAAYLWWGLCPIYFKSVAHVAPWEVLAHRIVWSLALLLVLLWFRGRLAEAWTAARRPRVLLALGASTLLVAVNWFTFIWAVANAQLLQASLGYFINPLVNVLLGLLVLRERLRPWQWTSLALAVAGVALMSWQLGEIPLISLVLAFSFGLYGLIRKTTPVGATVGLTIETALLAPVALGALLFWHGQDQLSFAQAGPGTAGLLALSGVVTALPLVWFAAAARRLRYATVGFLQYVAPSGQFLLAVLIYKEPFSQSELWSFAVIWLALAVYSIDAIVAGGRAPDQPRGN